MNGEQTSLATLRLVSAGVCSVGVGFGLARYGYGLLLPGIRASYGLGSGALGIIGSCSYLAYLAATAAAPVLATRSGPRVPVVLGGGAAALGMVLAGLSREPLLLAAGVLVAGASSGLVFPPFSDVVTRLVATGTRARALAAISSGTGWGVAVAAPIALAIGTSWRAAWLVFAGFGVLATLWSARVLPRGRLNGSGVAPRLRLAWLVCPRSGPLLAGALLAGLAASVYWTFAVDYVASAGSLPATVERLFLAVVGIASVAGTLAGDLVHRLGAKRAYVGAVVAFGSSLVLLALAPSELVAVALSAVLFGAAYNLVIAIQSIWSARVFAERPATGLAAVMFMVGLGLLLGPAAAGLLADQFGFEAVFVTGAGVALVAALVAPRERLVPGEAAQA